MLTREGFVRIVGERVELSDIGRVMAEHFIGVERLLKIIRLVQEKEDALDIVSELECSIDDEQRTDTTPPKEKGSFGTKKRSKQTKKR
jgi:helicase